MNICHNAFLDLQLLLCKLSFTYVFGIVILLLSENSAIDHYDVKLVTNDHSLSFL